jgi:DNA-binding PadR family transcriptional regulator
MYDPDMPSLYEALHREHADQYIEAMKEEIQSLIQQSTWKTIPRIEAKK